MDGAVYHKTATAFPDQVRAGRELLHWSQERLAAEAGISKFTIRNLETRASNPLLSTATAIRRALAEAGVVFLEAGETSPGGGPGVRLASNGADAATAPK